MQRTPAQRPIRSTKLILLQAYFARVDERPNNSHQFRICVGFRLPG